MTALERRYLTTHEQLTASIEQEIQAAGRAGREPDIELLKERMVNNLAALRSDSHAIHVTPVENQIRELLLTVKGKTAANIRAARSMDIPAMVTELWHAGVAVGQRQGPGEGFIVKSQAEYDAAVAKGVDDWKSANPGVSSRTSGGGAPDSRTESEILGDPNTPIETINRLMAAKGL